MIIEIPDNCQRIINVLEEGGYEAYIVGGCVRDSLLGTRPKDWDITTNALPAQVKELFANLDGFSIIPTGEKYGTVTVFCRGSREAYEVTTYRHDGDYTDGRRPDKVAFSKSIEDDLQRRDFTINAIAYNKNRGIVDLNNGRDHLKNKTLCLVGDPYERLKEDGLRIMRAIRFAYKLKFTIEPGTFKAISDSISHGYLNRISKERIRDELIAILEYFYFENNTFLLFEKMLFNIIPECAAMKGQQQFNPYHIFDVWEHTVIAIINTPANFVVRLIMLLHDIGKPETFTQDENGVGHFYGHPKVSAEIAGKILTRLKFDNKTKEKIITLVKYHDTPFMNSKKSVKRTLSKIGRESFEMLLDVRFADIVAHNPRFIYDKYRKLQTEKEIYTSVLEEAECFSLADLAVNGADLISIGLKGREIGEWLNKCLDLVMNDNNLNNKEILLDYIKQN